MDQAYGCRGLRFSLSMTEQTELGFSADDAIGALSSYQSLLAWLPASGPVQYVGGESTSTLTVALSSAPGEAFYIRSLDCNEGTCPATCISQVQLPLTVDLSTKSGEFSERWVGHLGTWEIGKGFIQREISLGDISGTLSPEDFSVDEGWIAETYELEIELNNSILRGRFQVRAVFSDGSEFDGALAVWPPPG